MIGLPRFFMSHFPPMIKDPRPLCVLAAMLLSSAARAEAKQGVPSLDAPPDVLVLVLSGTGPFDQVSINYTTAVSRQEAQKDIATLAREAAWIVREPRITTASASTPGAKPTTSSVFQTAPLANPREGTLLLEPLISALRRFRSIRVNYLVASRFSFRGLKDFSSDYVKIHLKQSGNSYLYLVEVANSRFDRLGLPLKENKPAPPPPAGMPTGARALLIAGIALAGAAAAYLAAVCACKGRRREQ